jgi:hypothetical protein
MLNRNKIKMHELTIKIQHKRGRGFGAQGGINDICICFAFNIGSRKINLRSKMVVFEQFRFI